jgi:DNA-binding MarR family transcriptional regulator
MTPMANTPTPVLDAFEPRDLNELVDLNLHLQRHFLLSLGLTTSSHRLSIPAYTLLSLLSAHGQMHVGAITQRLGHTMPATTGLVDRLSEHGLVERSPHPEDKRRVLVRITARGAQLMQTLRADLETSLVEITRRLNPDDRQAWLRIYRVMRDYCAEKQLRDSAVPADTAGA